MRLVPASLLTVVLMFTVGCAGLMNPRIPYPETTTKTDCARTDWDTVQGSLDCATVVRTQMEARAVNQAMVPRVIGAALIPLTATIAGLAITGTTGAPVTALTLAGVTTMGEGFWLTNPARRKTYSAGAAAVQCVITTVRPLRFRDDATRFTAFQTEIGVLPDRIRDVNAAVATVNIELSRAAAAIPAGDQRTALQNAVGEEVTAAQAVVAKAKLLQAAAEALVKRMNGATEEIHTSVDRIITLVNDEIDKSEPTMELVQQAIARQIQGQTSALSGLKALVDAAEREAKARAKAATGGAAGGAAPLAHSPLDKARDDLAGAVSRLTTTMSDVAKVVDEVGSPAPAQGCVDTARSAVGAAPLQITLGSEDPVPPGQSMVFLVSGGAGDVSITPADAAAAAQLEIRVTTVSGVRQVVVKTKSATPAGTYLVDVTDGFSNRVVKVVVKA
jgi:methionine-rich copper-binding protein CopC